MRKKKSRIHKARKSAQDLGDDAAINALYGLEPVFEPGPGTEGGPTEMVAIHCPYCDEPFTICVDLSAGSCSYIEDCQVCCQPVEIGCEIDGQGALQAVKADRSG